MEGDQKTNLTGGGVQNSTPPQNNTPTNFPTPATAPTSNAALDATPATPATLAPAPTQSQSSIPVQSRTPIQNPAQNSTTAQPSSNNPVAFNSADIGVKTAVKEDPFAQQNQRTAEKKQKAKKDRKKFYLVGGVIIAVVVISLVTWGLVVIFSNNNEQKPTEVVEDNDVTEEEITNLNTDATDLGQVAQEAFSEGGDNINAANQVFDQAIKEAQAGVEKNDNAETRYYANQVVMQKMGFYINKGFYNDAITLGEALDAESMVPEQQSSLYMLLATCYAYNGNEEKGMEYQNKAYQASLETGGGISGE